ncbi:MAG: glycosyltransferase family 4 protein [bacterium]|nr:glycosyltransferase family 4 protein [bacterium]
MKIFMAHNYYQQPGGEDRSFAAEADVLERYGHTVHRYTAHNDKINAMGKVQVARATIWNSDTYRELRTLFREGQFDVAHFQNTFPLISPAAYYAAQAEGVPVVQSLRNYRLMCLNALFFRDGHVCEDCLGKAVPYPGIVHSCYRDSRLQSAGVASMLVFHRAMRTYSKQIDRYIALTHFVKEKFIEAGMDAGKIIVKPNFLDTDPGIRPGQGDYLVFVARMTPEKGVWTVLKAWQSLPNAIPLKVVGDGPELDAMREFVATNNLNSVELLGHRKGAETQDIIKHARALILPSEWYETFGRVAMEAFACGVPVIASRIGAVAEVVENGQTGLHFMPGDVADLAEKVQRMWEDEALTARMGDEARRVFETRYTAERNYDMLMDVYNQAIQHQQVRQQTRGKRVHA